jgi:hypothetical protein
MKPKQVFDWKFRLMQDIVIAALLALFLSSSAQAEINSISCKLYLESPQSVRVAYVGGFIEGYSTAAQLLAIKADIKPTRKLSEEDMQTVRDFLSTAAAVVASDLKGVTKLTYGASTEMLGTFCAKMPDKSAATAFYAVMMQLQ